METRCDFSGSRNVGIDELIDGYLANRLSTRDSDDFELHILNCEVCYQKLYVREQLLGTVQEKGDLLFDDIIQKRQNKAGYRVLQAVRSGSHLLDRLMGSRRLIAAGFVAMLIVALPFLFQNRQSQGPTGSFAPSPSFEEIIASQDFRRATDNLTILSPKSGATFGQGEEILFRCSTTGGGQPVLKIMNNAGDKLFSFTMENHQHRFTDTLTPGLYYWKIETAGDFRMAKFYTLRQ